MDDTEVRDDARALRRAVARLQRSFRATRDPDGPTPAQLSALGTLHRDGPMATGALAARERLKPQSVTRLVAGLLENDFVERVPDDADHRRLVVAITGRGRRALVSEMRRRDQRLIAALSRLTFTERLMLRDACALIDRLADGEG